MSTYLLVENGIVVNAVVWDGDAETWSPPEGQAAIEPPSGSLAWIGWSYDGVTFSPPAS